MGMWTTQNQDEMNIVLRAFSDAAHKNYGSHSFEAGYLQSVVISMLPNLPKRMQRVFIEDMIRATKRQEKQFNDKTAENRTVDRVSV
jgi:hypothetical protein